MAPPFDTAVTFRTAPEHNHGTHVPIPRRPIPPRASATRLHWLIVQIVAIHIAPGRKVPTRSVQEVRAEAGKGLVGDRCHGAKHRHVTIQSRELLDHAAADLGRDVDSGATRRNLTVDAGPLPTKPGARIRIGDVELEVVRIAAPCRLLDDWIAPGAARAMHNRGGTVFRLLTSGPIRVGDEVEVPVAG